jgi:integrase
VSVRKRKWVTSKGEAKEAWIVDYADQDGNRHIETFEKKKDADAHHATVKVDVRKGVHTASSKSITIAEAGAKWITSGENNGLERATLESYQQHLTRHIVPCLGSVKMSRLTLPMVRDFKDKLHANGCSTAMIKRVVVDLGSILSDAQERGLVAQNVVRSLSPRKKRREAERRQKGKLKVGVDIPTLDEIRAIIAHLKGRWRPLILTAIFTGLRASELRGLRWQDIEFKKSKLYVHQRADRYNAIGKPKTAAGEREVPMLPMLANTLREWKLLCPKSDLGLVFPTGAGQIEYHSNIVTRGLAPAQIAAGVVVPAKDQHGKPLKDKDGNPAMAAKYTGLHALRHFYASWCINRRAEGGWELPAKVVQERLGHSSIVMTMDTYGHLFPRGDDAAELEAVQKALLG